MFRKINEVYFLKGDQKIGWFKKEPGIKINTQAHIYVHDWLMTAKTLRWHLPF